MMGKAIAYRLEEVPEPASNEAVENLFTEACRPFVNVRTLSPAADWNEQNRVWTATILFTPTDDHPRPKLLTDQCVIDSDFYGFTPWYTPTGTIEADVIALTGLAGHAFGSWALSPERMWLRDFLPQDLPRCRVLTYGYDSRLEDNTAHSILFDYSNNFKVKLQDLRAQGNCLDRPVVMVGHSLGCLIIKDTLINLAAIRDKGKGQQSPLPPIVCLVFLGAPHQGLEVTALQTLVKGKPSEELIRELAKQSPTLTRLNDTFKNLYGNFAVFTIYEKKPTKSVCQAEDGTWKRDGPLITMVEKDSAMLYWEHELCIGADQNHREIARINRGQGAYYNQIRGFIQKCLRTQLSKEEEKGGEYAVDSISQSRSRFFERMLPKKLMQNLTNMQGSQWQIQLRVQLESNFELPKLKSNKRPLGEKAHASTCEWVFSNEAYKQWMRGGRSSILWFKGSPGSGKSVLMSHLRSKLSGSFTGVILYFAFNEQFEKARQPLHLISSLLWQLTNHFPRETNALQPPLLSDAWSKRKDLQPGEENIWALFQKLIQNLAESVKRPRYIIILVDALDECQLRHGDELFRNLFRILTPGNNSSDAVAIKLAITARDNFFAQHQPLERLNLLHSTNLNNARSMPISSQVLDVSKYNREDILSYVYHELKLWSAPSTNLLQVLSILEAEIMQRAQGNFLWTVLVIEGLLEGSSSLDSALRTVRSLPEKSDLVDIYQRIMNNIPHDSYVCETVKRILLFTTTSSRPLKLEELADAVGTIATSDKRRLDPKKRPLHMQRDVEKMCRGLVSCTDALVRPMHATVTLFLEDRKNCKESFHQAKDHKHALFARTCLKYLQFEGVSKPQDDYSGAITQLPFLQYAADNFLFHAERSPEDDQLLLAEDVRSYIWNAERFAFWGQFVYEHGEILGSELRSLTTEPSKSPRTQILKGVTQVHFLALLMTKRRLFERVALQKCPIDKKVLLTSKDIRHQTALHWAAATSKYYLKELQADEEDIHANKEVENIVSSLIDYGFNVHSTDADFLTPLHVAVFRGREDYVETLLKHGSEINAMDERHASPLHYAAIANNNLHIINILLRQRPKIDAREKNQLTPLHLATMCGHTETVRALIADGATIDARDQGQSTPLHLATACGHTETLRALIADGATIDARDKNQLTPLHVAAAYGHIELARALILDAATIDARHEDQWTPLHFATVNGYTEIARALIAGGATIDALGKDQLTPLHLATARGHTETVRALIADGATIDARGKDQLTPLHLATVGGHTETVRALIAGGATIDAREQN